MFFDEVHDLTRQIYIAAALVLPVVLVVLGVLVAFVSVFFSQLTTTSVSFRGRGSLEIGSDGDGVLLSNSSDLSNEACLALSCEWQNFHGRSTVGGLGSRAPHAERPKVEATSPIFVVFVVAALLGLQRFLQTLTRFSSRPSKGGGVLAGVVSAFAAPPR